MSEPDASGRAMMYALFVEDVMRLALLFLLLVSTRAFAGEVLIEHIPRGASPDIVVAVVQRAFIGRGWTVVETTPTSVTATITREAKQVIRGRMSISIEGDALVYTGGAKYRTASPSGGVLAYERPISAMWVDNLRRDIGLTLATIPDR